MDPIRSSLNCHLSLVPNRLKNVAREYVLMAAVEDGSHSARQAARSSNISASSFSNLLSKGGELPSKQIEGLASSILSSEKCSPLVSKSPWKIAIIIDSTNHRRSSAKVENSQKFSKRGKHFEGHQWTNILIMTAGKRIPLPPIPFYTKAYCTANNIEYKTEPVRVRELLSKLDLSKYVGEHESREVVVLLDSGYDVRDLQKVIIMNGWDFIASLKCSTKVSSSGSITKKRVEKVFLAGTGHHWKTVYRFDRSRKNRKDFRTCATTGYLNGLHEVEGQVVCSELGRDRQNRRTRKYLFCSDVDVDLGVIVRLYAERWNIEVFHKEMKSRMGMEKSRFRDFKSVHAHVCWCYVAYLFLGSRSPTAGLSQSKYKLKNSLQKQKVSQYRHTLNLYGGRGRLRSLYLAEERLLEAS